jgi:FSR family fosmidomycin resistance protein-like MFS transporter
MPLLLVEMFDEMAYGFEPSAAPAIRAELGLSFGQMGLLFGLPGLLNAFLEPGVLLLGDGPWRRRLILMGGLLLGGAFLATAAAQTLALLLAAAVVAYPASGAFVSLSQASLVDASPGREAPMMARWTAAGSIGSLLGPAIIAGSLALGAGWRLPYALAGAIGIALALLTHSGPQARAHPPPAGGRSLGQLIGVALEMARDRAMRRWILLLQVSDLMLDILSGYAGLYLVGVAGLGPASAALALGGMTAAGLAADLASIWLLERIPGRRILRVGAILAAAVYPILLAAPWAGAKVALLLLIRLLTLGWYPVLQGEAYAAAPGRSGAMLAFSSVAGVIGAALAWLVGALAELAGLQAAMWLILLAPVSLILFLPSPKDG